MRSKRNVGVGIKGAAALAERASRFVARSGCKEQQSLRSQGTSVVHWPLAAGLTSAFTISGSEGG